MFTRGRSAGLPAASIAGMLRPVTRLCTALVLAGIYLAGMHALPAQAPSLGERVTVEELRQEAAPTETDATAQRFLDTYRQAIGGTELIAGVTTLRRTGTVRDGRQSVEVTEIFALPDRIRRETRWRDSGRDHLEVLATDGTNGWQWVVQPQPKRPRELGAGEVNALKAQIDLFGPLIHGPELGWHFAYRGPARIRTRPGFLVLGASPQGVRQWFYFDAETYLCTRIGSRETFAGQAADADRFHVRFAMAGGIWWPAEIEYQTSGRTYRHENWTRIEPGVAVDDAMFRPPPQREILLRPRPDR